MNDDTTTFRDELEHFRRDVEAGLQSLYAYLAIHNISSQRKTILSALNHTPLLWNTLLSSLQNNYFILLGRLFDRTTVHNAYELIEYATSHPAIFSRESLALRKAPDPINQPSWVQGYVARAYVPRPSDFRRLSDLLEKRSRTYVTKFRDIRSKVVAHKVIAKQSEIEALFSRAKYGEIIDIYIFLHQLHNCLWELLENGRKPVIKQQVRSVRRMQSAKKHPWQSGKVQEVIVRETKDLLKAIERGQPNNALQLIRGPRRATKR